ncbi:MAG: phosphopyruvate hydratase [Alphaproteobacteria bacterium]|nr:phosphopyruvate hydratase [Alphaproteobacteria bacterium]
MATTALRALRAREILDSRGYPTVAVEVTLEAGIRALAAVPSGASTGTHEAHERRDGDPARYRGRGVRAAVAAVEGEIQDAVIGLDAMDQRTLDDALNTLDGTPDKSRLGANALLGVSLAAARAAARSQGVPLYRHLGGLGARTLPTPLMNLLNGGAHARNGLDVQEFMIVPGGAPTFAEAVRWGSEIFHTLADLLAEAGHGTGLGDEGGFAPALASTDAAIGCLLQAIERAGYRPGEEVGIALDAAAGELLEDGRYRLAGEDRTLDAAELAAYWTALLDRHPIVSIEDPFGDDDWDAWQAFTAAAGKRLQIVGDDLFVTNVGRLDKGIDGGAANALLAKVNQVGTLSEALDAMQRAAAVGFGVIASHRSGETEDTTIADLAVGTGCGQIKTGSLARGERTAKYNRLLAITDELGAGARYAGWQALRQER